MKIGFVGAGNMAEAIIKGILAAKSFKPEDILISDLRKDRLNYLRDLCKVTTLENNQTLISRSDAVIVAVKPKDIDNVIADLKAAMKKDALIISIAAGISTGYYEEKVRASVPVIRVMPNTPALVRHGVTAISKGKNADSNHLNTAISIFSSIGIYVEVDEKFMDAVTAVSGSGPAYVFFFFEALSEAAVKIGLEKEIADILAFNTIYGAARMALETKDDPARLRNKVTSPGGTTEAALKVFEEKGLKEIIFNAVKAAAERSKELTK